MFTFAAPFRYVSVKQCNPPSSSVSGSAMDSSPSHPVSKRPRTSEIVIQDLSESIYSHSKSESQPYVDSGREGKVSNVASDVHGSRSSVKRKRQKYAGRVDRTSQCRGDSKAITRTEANAYYPYEECAFLPSDFLHQ